MAEVREYAFERGKDVEASLLRYCGRGERIYSDGRKVLVRACHDVFIKYLDKILLVTRNSEPAKGEIWPVGGGIERGVNTLDSLSKLTLGEVGLNLVPPLDFLGMVRFFWQVSPEGIEKGTGADDLSLVYFAKAKGILSLDKLHTNPLLVSQKNYPVLRERFHPFVKDFLDKIIETL